MKLHTLKCGWVKLESCTRDLFIVCICCLFWQKYLVLLDIPNSTAALEQPGKRIASNSFLCVTSRLFLLVHCHFSTCANLFHKLKVVQLSVLYWGCHWGCRAVLACLNAKQNWRNPTWLSDPRLSLQCWWLWGNSYSNWSTQKLNRSAKNKPGALCSNFNKHLYSFPCWAHYGF